MLFKNARVISFCFFLPPSLFVPLVRTEMEATCWACH